MGCGEHSPAEESPLSFVRCSCLLPGQIQFCGGRDHAKPLSRPALAAGSLAGVTWALQSLSHSSLWETLPPWLLSLWPQPSLRDLSLSRRHQLYCPEQLSSSLGYGHSEISKGLLGSSKSSPLPGTYGRDQDREGPRLAKVTPQGRASSGPGLDFWPPNSGPPQEFG